MCVSISFQAPLEILLKILTRSLSESPKSGWTEELLRSFSTVLGEGGVTLRADSPDDTLRWTAPLAVRVGVGNIDA